MKLNLLFVLTLLTVTTNLNKAYASDLIIDKDREIILDELSQDTDPPVIEIISPLNDEIFTEPGVVVIFTVSDDNEVKEVSVNGASLPVSPDGQYSQDVTLSSGENIISITAKDLNENKSTAELNIGFFEGFDDLGNELEDSIKELEEALELTEELIGELEDKEIINLIGDFFNDLNEALIDAFSTLTEGLNELIDITNTVSVEIENAPEIPEGQEAEFELPEFEGVDFFEELKNVFEIPKGFSFATDIAFKDFEESVTINNEDLSDKNTAVLVDASGKTFVVGFGFLEMAEGEATNFRNPLKKNHRFQTTNGEPLKLTTTITIPADAKEGDAKVSILSKNKSLATIPLKVAPPKEVKVGKRSIGKPQISKPIIAKVTKSGKKLSLKIKGKNFVQKIATIDGKLERLLGKASFTNVTFVPSDGIKVKSIKVRKNSINVTAEIQDDIKSGIKLFNVITPKGADIGAIVFPNPIVSGSLETSAAPEGLILGR